MVPGEGVEPSHPYGYQILSLMRLPFRHPGILSQRPDTIRHRKWYSSPNEDRKSIRVEVENAMGRFIVRLKKDAPPQVEHLIQLGEHPMTRAQLQGELELADRFVNETG